jgi:nucleotide-binding universal stress UspA family protein
MSWKPIVVGVDSSPQAVDAATFASRLAARAGATCRLIHATRDALVAPEVPESARYRDALAQQARALVITTLEDALPPQLLDALAVRLGPTPVVLKQAVAELDAELVVLGGKHHSALGRWIGGSTSLDVARTTEVPLLVTAGPTAMRRVLVAVDISGAARPTLAAAERYATMLGAELRALSVLEPLPVIPNVTPPYDASEFYAMSEELLQREVWSLVRTPGADKVVRYGLAVDTIIREASEWSADLLVVGSHGKGWAERLLLGSVTERLLNHLPTSLLVIPAPARATERVSERHSAMVCPSPATCTSQA